jgi:hypothetical protein
MITATAADQTITVTAALSNVQAIEVIVFPAGEFPVDGQALAGGAFLGGLFAAQGNGYLYYDGEPGWVLSGSVDLFSLTFAAGVPELDIFYFYVHAAGHQPDPDNLGGRWNGGRLTGSAAKCASDYGCYWARPEFGETRLDYRKMDGASAQKWFSYGRQHQAGLYQVVGGLEAGAAYHFSAWFSTWECYEWENCAGGRVSDEPYGIQLRVGIDQAGGVDPYAASVQWGAWFTATDRWTRGEALAWASAPTITVLIESRALFDWARLNNDVYVDAASLTVCEGCTRVYLPVVGSGE